MTLSNLDYFETNILTPRLIGPRASGLRLLLIGTCQIEHLLSSSQRYGFEVDHILYDGLYAPDLPDVSQGTYDAVLVSLTLRTVANAVSGGAHDVFFLSDNWDDSAADTALDRAEELMRSSLVTVREKSPGIPIFVMTFLEPSRNLAGNLIYSLNGNSDIHKFVRSLNDALVRVVSKIPQAFIFDFNQAMNFVGRAHLHDDVVNCTTHASIISGFDDEYDRDRIVPPTSNLSVFNVSDNLELLHSYIYNTISDNVQIINNINPIKIIITDLDDTLWRGIAAENDIQDNLRVEGWPLGYQEALLQYRRRGGLLAICSKNDDGPTRENFQRLCGNRIFIDDFVSVKINFRSKSENIAEILSEANLLSENALFIDDNPREISEVQTRFPALRCLAGNHHDWRRIILFAPETQVAHISRESRERTHLVRASIVRETMAQTMPREEWLKSLEIRQNFILLNDFEHPASQRTLELINKTNQFNTTGRRWQAGELIELFAEGGCCIVAALKDKNVDNGIIGVAIVRPGEIIQTVLSCRVFGLGAELALGSIAIAVALTDHAEVHSQIVNTGKNATCRNYLERLGFNNGDDGFSIRAVPPAPDWIELSMPAELEQLHQTIKI